MLPDVIIVNVVSYRAMELCRVSQEAPSRGHNLPLTMMGGDGCPVNRRQVAPPAFCHDLRRGYKSIAYSSWALVEKKQAAGCLQKVAVIKVKRLLLAVESSKRPDLSSPFQKRTQYSLGLEIPQWKYNFGCNLLIFIIYKTFEFLYR